MFRMDRNSQGNQVGNETANNQPPPAWPRNNAPAEASAHPQTHTQTPSNSRAMTESESLARDIKDGVLNGFVGNGTVLTGEASFKGMLRVDGRMSGRVASADGTLVVGTNGQVDANVEVTIATIHGTVNGDIIATKRIEIGRTAKVNGNIQTPSLVIEQGAVFEGNCRMLHLTKAQDKQREEKQTAGAPVEAGPTHPTEPLKKVNWSPTSSEATPKDGEPNGAPHRKNQHGSPKPVNA